MGKLKHWACVLAAVGYALMPLDLIPDFLPVLGWTDDGVVMAWGIKHLLKALKV